MPNLSRAMAADREYAVVPGLPLAYVIGTSEGKLTFNVVTPPGERDVWFFIRKYGVVVATAGFKDGVETVKSLGVRMAVGDTCRDSCFCFVPVPSDGTRPEQPVVKTTDEAIYIAKTRVDAARKRLAEPGRAAVSPWDADYPTPVVMAFENVMLEGRYGAWADVCVGVAELPDGRWMGVESFPVDVHDMFVQLYKAAVATGDKDTTVGKQVAKFFERRASEGFQEARALVAAGYARHDSWYRAHQQYTGMRAAYYGMRELMIQDVAVKLLGAATIMDAKSRTIRRGLEAATTAATAAIRVARAELPLDVLKDVGPRTIAEHASAAVLAAFQVASAAAPAAAESETPSA